MKDSQKEDQNVQLVQSSRSNQLLLPLQVIATQHFSVSVWRYFWFNTLNTV